MLTVGPDEASGKGGESELTKQLSLIFDISKSLTFDGWVVIGLCFILALIAGIVAVLKLLYLGRIGRATKVFLVQWDDLSSNLHVLDHGNEDSINSMGRQSFRKGAENPAPVAALSPLPDRLVGNSRPCRGGRRSLQWPLRPLDAGDPGDPGRRHGARDTEAQPAVSSS
ncbi:MAG: hypothetical protein WDN28_33305 [Chthoniobacter sp.]